MNTELENLASATGREYGWDFAEYVGAYGGDLAAAPEVPPRFVDVESFFLSGWEEGVSNFAEGLRANGSPRDAA